ncbi:MAG: GTP pyrophosphokinase family protein [Ruminococcaceae bacterium]|nr:GTP pyrophosphokinase family protein [Oscillospiraceae bacterium]
MPEHMMPEDGRFVEDASEYIKRKQLGVNMTEFLEQMFIYNSAIKKVRTTLEILDNEFHVKNDYNPIHHIETRLKTPKSIFKKLEKRGMPATIESMKENLTDIAGVRVIVNYIDDAYRIAELLLSHNDIELIEKRDYIVTPKPSGYRSLHVIAYVSVYLSSGFIKVPTEIQIRTIAMDYWATLEHRLKYKNEGTVPEGFHGKLKLYSEEIASMEEKVQELHREAEGFYK